MLLFIICILLIIVIAYCIKNHVVIHFKSFFKKGFKLKNNKYGCYSFTRQTTALGKTLSCITFILDLVKKQDLKVITNVKSFADNYKNFCTYEDNFYNIVDRF